jgi:hypothetical protein
MGFLQKIHIMSEVVQNVVTKKRQNALYCERDSKMQQKPEAEERKRQSRA